MEEGTNPPYPGSGMPGQKNPWQTTSTVFPAQDFPEPSTAPETSQFPPGSAPVVFRAKDAPGGSQGFAPPKSSLGKILKILIGLLVIFSIIISILIFFLMPKPQGKSDEPITLTYWGLFEDESVFRPVLAEFEKENPNIKIDYKKQDLSDYREKLSARTANGTGPDIFRFHPNWYPMLSDVLMPLPNETIEKSEFDEKYYEVMKKDLIKNGTTYGIPLYTDTLSLFINTALFQETATESGGEIPVPKTWQEFIDTSERLTKRDESGAISQAGAGIGAFDNVVHAPDIISLLFAQNGVDLNDLGAHQEKVADALRFYTNFSQVEKNVWDATQDTTQLVFSQGKLAMYFGYSWDYDTFKKSNPGLQIKIVPVPQLVSDEKVNIASYWAEGANQQTKHPKEVLLFMKFLARTDVQEKLYAEEAKVRQFGEPYSIKSLAGKLNGTDAFVFVDQSNSAISSPFVGAAIDKGLTDKYNASLKEEVNNLLSGDSEEDVAQKFLDGVSQTKGEFFAIPRK